MGDGVHCATGFDKKKKISEIPIKKIAAETTSLFYVCDLYDPFAK